MNNKQTQQKLINNLKKQLTSKRTAYNNSIYQYAILTVAESIFPANKNSFNYSNLPLIDGKIK